MNGCRKKGRKKGISAVFLVFLGVVIFSGCVSRPGEPDWAGILPGDYSVYFSMDRESARILLPPVLDSHENGSLEKYLKKVDRIFGGTRTSLDADLFGPVAPGDISLAVAGEFPRLLLSCALGADKSWKKVRSSGNFWRNDQGIEVAPVSSGMIYVSWGRMEELIRSYQAVRGEGNPGEGVLINRQILEKLYTGDLVITGTEWPFIDLPVRDGTIQSWTVVLDNTDSGLFRGSVSVSFGDERNARFFAATLRLLSLGSFSGEAEPSLVEKLLALPVERNENSVYFSGLELTGDELTGMFSGFLPQGQKTGDSESR